MPDTDPGVIDLYPWMRRGAVTLPHDTLGAGLPGAASVPVVLDVRNNPPVQQQIRLAAPSDVIGFDASQVIRTEPPDYTKNYEPNFLAAVEFAIPDFPWLFTPASPDPNGRLRPWLCLVVVRQQDGVTITIDPSRMAAILEIKLPAVLSAELPDLAQSWAWAHAQVAGQVTAGQTVAQLDAASPERTSSRLLCPRRLTPDTDYIACVVPAFESGRKAGLGLTMTAADDSALLPAWTMDLQAVQLPVYYQWRFSTGPVGDFASLVKLLKTYTFDPSSGVRPMYVGASGQGMPAEPITAADATLGLESALMPVGSTSPVWTGPLSKSFATAIRSLIRVPLNKSDDPPVGPPLYAGKQADKLIVPDDDPAPPVSPPPANAAPTWLRELNVDPRNRAVAAFGVRVVQDQQEALMASAWDQVGEIQLANRILLHAQLVRRASAAVYQRHLAGLPTNTLLNISRPIHTRIALAPGATVTKVFSDNNLPASIVSRTFRTIARPRGPVMRAVLPPAQQVVRPVVTGIALRRIPVVLASPAFGVVTPDIVEQRYRAAGGTRPANQGISYMGMQSSQNASIPLRPFFAVRPPLLPGVTPPPPFRIDIPVKHDSAQAAAFRAAQAAHQALVGPNVMIFIPPHLLPLDVETLKPALLARINPQTAIAGWVKPVIRGGVASTAATPSATNDDLDPVTLAPQFPQPMYEALRDLSQDLLAPALQNVPDNRVALLQTNPKFVEAFMAGLNHEMARELLWRSYPTDQRGTYFQTFWDRRGAPANVDIPPIHIWGAGTHLGGNATTAGNALVFLIRGEITRRYPDALIYMAQAVWNSGQTRPSLGTQEVQPAFRGTLQPDISFCGFPLTVKQALGSKTPADPGYFFVIQEHPCAPRFGLEPDAPAGPLQTGGDAAATARNLLQTPVRIAVFASDLLTAS